MVCLYRSPIPVGMRGVISSFKLFLPAFPRVEEGEGGGRHPVVPAHPTVAGPSFSVLFLFVTTSMGCINRSPTHHELINCKDTKTKCRLYWCFIEFIDWRYSQSCWYFRPSFVNYCPSNLLSASIYSCNATYVQLGY